MRSTAATDGAMVLRPRRSCGGYSARSGVRNRLYEDSCHRRDGIRRRQPGRAARARGPRGPLPGPRPGSRVPSGCPRLRAARRRRAPAREHAGRRHGDRRRLLPGALDGAWQGRRLPHQGRRGGTRIRRHGAARGSRAGHVSGRAWRPSTVGAPAQPPRDRSGAGGRGTGADLLPRRHGGRRTQRVLPDPALPGRAPAGDDRTRLDQDPDATDRDRRRAGLPRTGAAGPGVQGPRGADRRTGRPLLWGDARPHGRRPRALRTGRSCRCRSCPRGSHHCGSGS